MVAEERGGRWREGEGAAGAGEAPSGGGNWGSGSVARGRLHQRYADQKLVIVVCIFLIRMCIV
jgi:hypothetical protein